jgi:hypothetical protein
MSDSVSGIFETATPPLAVACGYQGLLKDCGFLQGSSFS